LTGFEILPATGHARMRWVNGGGWTTEIVAAPSSNTWQWRLSVADVAAAGPFSLFPGVDRTIALLRGNGFALTIGGQVECLVDTPFEPFEFSGDESTSCGLIDGPVQDINLMTRRDSAPHRLEFSFIPPSSTIELRNVEVALVVDGGARLFGRDLGYLDAIRSSSPSALLRLTSMQSGAVVASVIPLAHG
jgi:environmental stress-induced protein Ves